MVCDHFLKISFQSKNCQFLYVLISNLNLSVFHSMHSKSPFKASIFKRPSTNDPLFQTLHNKLSGQKSSKVSFKFFPLPILTAPQKALLSIKFYSNDQNLYLIKPWKIIHVATRKGYCWKTLTIIIKINVIVYDDIRFCPNNSYVP